MLSDYHNLIIARVKNGRKYAEIKEELYTVYGYSVTVQAISKYIKTIQKKQEKIEENIIEPRVIECIRRCKSAREAHIILNRNGYNVSYYRVAQIKNSLSNEIVKKQ